MVVVGIMELSEDMNESSALFCVRYFFTFY
jgi:hypothetical protein